MLKELYLAAFFKPRRNTDIFPLLPKYSEVKLYELLNSSGSDSTNLPVGLDPERYSVRPTCHDHD